MKLQNKKTDVVIDGEIRDVFYDNIAKIKLIDKATGSIIAMYNSFAKLNEEWKDYEEEKDHYFIEMNGIVNVVENLEYEMDFIESKVVPQLKEIGNYFDTKEEAEKAVERRKAWKRLKDKGFKFEGWGVMPPFKDCGELYNESQLFIRTSIKGQGERPPYEEIEQAKAEIDLLFGGEE